MVDNQALMMFNFQTAMKKLAVVGQNVQKLVDCSDLIPKPPAAVKAHATYVSLQTLIFTRLLIVSSKIPRRPEQV